MKSFFLTAAVCIICCLICGSCVSINCGGGNFPVRIEKGMYLQHQISPGAALRAHTAHGEIMVRPASNDICAIKANIRIHAKNDQVAEEIARKIKLKFKELPGSLAVIKDFPEDPDRYIVHIGYDIQIPQERNLDLKTSHAPIRCEQLRANINAVTTHDPIVLSDITGNVNLSTTHDPVTCTNITGNINASSTHDPIIVRNIRGNLNLSTTHGKIQMADITGNINAVTTHDPIIAEDVTGNMSLRTTHDEIVCKRLNTSCLKASTTHDRVDIAFRENMNSQLNAEVRTTHGDIHFEMPAGFTGKTELSTTHGKIITQIPIMVTGEISEENVSGIIGANNQNSKIILKTTHASIVLR